MSTDSLTHHGIKGMKWGRRKSRPTSSNSNKKSSTKKKKDTSTKRKKILTDSRKQTLKKVAKTTAIAAGSIAAAAALGYLGSVGFNAFMTTYHPDAIKSSIKRTTTTILDDGSPVTKDRYYVETYGGKKYLK